jgi:hypothetical protein
MLFTKGGTNEGGRAITNQTIPTDRRFHLAFDKTKVARFGLLVAREAAFHKLSVARFTVREVCKSAPPPVAAYFFESLTIN